MSQIIDKYCENCGKLNGIEAQFCKTCGHKFPAIDHPKYREADPNFIADAGEGSIQPSSPQQPSYVPATRNQPQSPSYITPVDSNQQPFLPHVLPPRAWTGGGLINAIFAFYKTPSKSSVELLEDPKAPSSFTIVVLTAISLAYLTYLQGTKLILTDYDATSSAETKLVNGGLEDQARNNAVAMFTLVMIFWFVGSWLVGKLIRGGLPADHYLKNQTTKAMRQLFGFLYFTILIKSAISTILLLLEDKIEAEVLTEELFGVESAFAVPTGDYSALYTNFILVSTLVTTFIIATLFYRIIVRGLGNRGTAPMVITMLYIFVALFYF